MSGNWYDDRTNLALLARYMEQQGDSASDVVYMLEKPQKFEDDWRLCVDANLASSDGWLKGEAARAAGRASSVPPHARPRLVKVLPCATCSGRGVWMDEPCGDCSA